MKKTTISINLFLIIVLFFNVNINAQEADWSLEKCIDYALKNNIQIKQQELNTKYSGNLLKQSRADILPSINASLSENFNFGRSVDMLTYQYTNENTKQSNFSINTSVNLFNGFQTINTIKQNQLNLQSSLADLEKIKNDVSLNIASAFLQILFSEELLEVANNQLVTTKLQLTRIQQLVEAGTLAQGSLLDVQSQIASEELQIVNSQNQLDIAYLNLVQMLDIDSVGNFKINKPAIQNFGNETLPFSVEQIFAESVNKMPQIQSAEFKLLSSQKGLSIAKGRISPSLSLSGSYYTGYSDKMTNLGTTEKMAFNDQIKNNARKAIGFDLTIPIFNKLQTHTAISNSKIDILNSDYTLQTAKNQLHKEIQQAYADAMAAMKKYFATEKTVTSMEESFRYTQQKFDVGMLNSVDYNLAKNNLAKTKSDLLQAKYEYIFKTKILDFYRGTPIKL